MKRILLLAFTVTFIAFGCKPDKAVTPMQPVDTTSKLTPYTLTAPTFFPPIVVPDSANKPYVERIALGRRLYYDPILSNDGRSCSQCHIQTKGFTSDHISADSLTVMPHVNLAWNQNWLWNGGTVGPMEAVMLFETHDFFQTDTTKINADTTYRRLFKQAYGVNQITFREITFALSQFIRTMISQNSRYYQRLRGEIQFTRDEQAGEEMFNNETGNCFHCHSVALLTDNDFHNNGLDSDFSSVKDRGRFNVTGRAEDMGRFRTPSLYNVALRKHFMHDGRFTTLEQVVDFYNKKPKPSATLDFFMTQNDKETKGLGLSDIQKYQLVLFLKTFTDTTFLTNPAFSRPQ